MDCGGGAIDDTGLNVNVDADPPDVVVPGRRDEVLDGAGVPNGEVYRLARGPKMLSENVGEVGCSEKLERREVLLDWGLPKGSFAQASARLPRRSADKFVH